MAFSNPAVADFKAQFFRDFPYGTDQNKSVLDQDIAGAFVKTNVMINPSFFGDQASYTLGYLTLAAHYMVMNLRASSQGINGQFAWLEQSKGAGPVSQAFAIPQRILDNPAMAVLTKTNYGLSYLEMILPQLSGAMFAVCGRTCP